MAWFAELAGKAEHLLNNLDEQTGAALRNHNVNNLNKKSTLSEPPLSELQWKHHNRPIPRTLNKVPTTPSNNHFSSNNRTVKKPPASTQPQKELGKPWKALTKFSSDNGPKSESVKNYEYSNKCRRRASVPTGSDKSSLVKLELENNMLKNELSVMSNDLTDLISKLSTAEKELSIVKERADKTAEMYEETKKEKTILCKELNQIKVKVTEFTNTELEKHKMQKREIANENAVLKDRIKDLEENITRLNKHKDDQESLYLDLEKQLHHAKTNISNLESDLKKSKEECMKMESEWETYKNRVKSMLAGKEKEIKALQQGLQLSEDTKTLISQIENLKKERSMFAENVTQLRCENEEMSQYMETLESRHSAAERVVVALRDALRDERSARNRAETQSNSLAKELKSIQIEMGHTISTLRSQIRDKDQEISQLASSTTSMARPSTISSALNVGDYENRSDTDSSSEIDKVHSLTQTLMQKQKQIEVLMAENNMMKITIDKHKVEINKNKQARDKSESRKGHSVVNFQDGSPAHWSRVAQTSETGFTKLSRRIGSLIRAFPQLRICIIVYMVCLQIWVITVLYSSKIDDKVR